MKEYLVTQAKRLDTVIYEHYKTLDVLEKVLEVNKKYFHKLILQAGDIVILPNFIIEKTTKGNALWD